jgi:hypothetical protein
MQKDFLDSTGQTIGTLAAGVLFSSAIVGSIALDFIVLYSIMTNIEKSNNDFERTCWTIYLLNTISNQNRSHGDLGAMILLSPVTSGLAIGLLYYYHFNLAASIIACSWGAGVGLALIAIACTAIAEYQKKGSVQELGTSSQGVPLRCHGIGSRIR